MKPHWTGVFPACTTQLKKDQSLDLPATARHFEALIESGVSGLIVCGSLGENQTLDPEEKRAVVKCAIETARGRVPVLSGVAESSTRAAVRYVRDVKELGAAGVMLMPPMSYKGDPRESMTYLRTVAKDGGLPIMIYNNPISYANDITPALFAELADEPKFVAIKESSGDPRRITELRNAVGDRYAVFTGVDDLLLEAAILGIDGWVAGTGIASPPRTNASGTSRARASGTRRARSTAGSSRCSNSIRTSTSCNTSSCASRRPASVSNGFAPRACPSPVPNGRPC